MFGLVLGFVLELLLLVVAPGAIAAAFGPFGLMIGDDVGFGFGLEFGFGGAADITPVLLSTLGFCTGVPVGVVVVLELVLLPLAPVLPAVPPLVEPLVWATAPQDSAVAHNSASSRMLFLEISDFMSLSWCWLLPTGPARFAGKPSMAACP